MSKIDEIIDDIKFNNWVANEFIIEELEQLRPYVELAEYIIGHIELIKTDWHGVSAPEFLKSYNGLILLVKQIKEQSNENL